MERGSTRWSSVVVVVPALVVFGVLLPLVAFWPRYPDPLAVQWEISGPPNAEMPLATYAVVLTAGMVLSWGALIAGARESIPSAPLTAVTYFIMGLLAAVNAQTVVANLDAPLLLMVATAIVMVAFSSVRTEADGQGAAVRMGSFGWPRTSIPMEEITGAAAFDVKPMAYCGWGYRMRSGARAVIIRSGPAVRIEHTEGPDLLVTVDDAAVGAASIGALVRR